MTPVSAGGVSSVTAAAPSAALVTPAG
jgi:hypothetical protein